MALQPITVILSFTIHEDKREEFFQVALEEVKKIRAFKGNVHAYLSADAKKPEPPCNG